MDNENNGIVEPTNDTEVETVETQDEATNEVDVVKLQETNKRLFERAKKAEAELKELRRPKVQSSDSKTPLTTPKVEESLVKDIQDLKIAEQKRQFGYKHSLSPEETDKLFKFAGNSDPAEALKDPFFQAGLKESRRSQRIAEATPSSSNRSSKVDGKTFAEMTEEERQKNWSKITKK